MDTMVMQIVWICAEVLLVVLFAVLTVTLSRRDLVRGVIPDAVLLPGLLLSVALVGAASLSRSVGAPIAWWEPMLVALAGGLGLAALLLVIMIASPRNMGFGDVKLALLTGLVAGYAAGVLGVLIAAAVMFVSGGCAALVLRKRRHDGSTIAFAPFMFLGAWVSLIFGAGVRLVDWVQM